MGAMMIPNIYEQLEMPDYNRFLSITKAESEFIYRFLKEKNIKRTLEVGFAYGCSAAHIISATQSNHYAIDNNQPGCNSQGLKNLAKLDLDKYLILKEDKSHNVLPTLLNEGLTLEFAFIDGGHKFDEIFVDFYYLDLMMENHSYILLHDRWMYSTQMVVAWVRSNKKNYQEITTPIKALTLFQKVKDDNRKWFDFGDFETAWNEVKTTDRKYYDRVVRELICHFNKVVDEDLLEEISDVNQL